MNGLLHGNLEVSLRTRHPVVHRHRHLPAGHRGAGHRPPWSWPCCSAPLFGLRVGGPLPGGGAFRLVCSGLASAPVFLLALLGILIFSGDLHWLPGTGDTGYTNAPTGPTGIIIIDGLIHGQPAWPGTVSAT